MLKIRANRDICSQSNSASLLRIVALAGACGLQILFMTLLTLPFTPTPIHYLPRRKDALLVRIYDSHKIAHAPQIVTPKKVSRHVAAIIRRQLNRNVKDKKTLTNVAKNKTNISKTSFVSSAPVLVEGSEFDIPHTAMNFAARLPVRRLLPGTSRAIVKGIHLDPPWSDSIFNKIARLGQTLTCGQTAVIADLPPAERDGRGFTIHQLYKMRKSYHCK